MYGFCHIEIPTTNVEKSKQFYEQVFGWDTESIPDMNYTTFTPEDGPAGGFRTVDSIDDSKGVLVYIQVEEIEEMLDKIAQHGGEILKEKDAVADMGWEAHFADPSGVVMGIWEAKEEADSE
ncbi:MAG: VOC family protein [Candidatus Marinimicrobia bacterium]|nr:VOC family protein [Candidatus Neomarinimicrobiota bacterium]MCF7828521.1 VOC family protein [Candidatus Neomarinimicrobiota bacterium]MCF7882056.1 VOC family protein [Candidatus Neomarinimicrobiota bacterium]